jgi:hypothetical protein
MTNKISNKLAFELYFSMERLSLVECRSLSQVLPIGLIWLEIKTHGSGFIKITDMHTNECYFKKRILAREKNFEISVPISSTLVIETGYLACKRKWLINTDSTRKDKYRIPPSLIKHISMSWKSNAQGRFDKALSVLWHLKFPRVNLNSKNVTWDKKNLEKTGGISNSFWQLNFPRVDKEVTFKNELENLRLPRLSQFIQKIEMENVKDKEKIQLDRNGYAPELSN